MQQGTGDLFDNVLDLEKHCFKQGVQLGQQKAVQEAHQQGFAFGHDQGKKLAQELGTMAGFVTALQAHLKNTKQFANQDRILQTAEQVQQLLSKVPWHDMTGVDSNLMELLEQVRNKYKLLHIRMGMKEKAQPQQQYSF